MYKVFINEKVYFLGFNLKKSFFKENVCILDCCDLDKFNEILRSESNPQEIIVNFPTYRVLKKVLKSRYRIVEAGGGLVLNNKNEILFIFRRGRWDLPKGKLEKHEKITEGAIREVEEECGITSPEVREDLVTTHHKYKNKGKECIKKTYWYIMDYYGKEKLVPQLEEDITKVKWMGVEKFSKVYSNTFPSIKDVLDAYLERIKTNEEIKSPK